MLVSGLDLDVRADGTYDLKLTRPLMEAGEMKDEARGAWQLAAGGLDLRHPPGLDGAPRGMGTLDAEGRLLFEHGDWALVLCRAEAPR